ncbi:acyl-CoA thioesterase [Cumulibacter soli]|uniref:acyl-CoA thioesterase n=1 Tax=Cumulibacter soli TaxID=2546344 RepID=UPI0010687878|nr:acyl-CoA thioesterase domain-containing protein [Cumulibacter soli]
MPLTLREVLDLKEVTTDSFRAPTAAGGDRLFGGFLLGQAFVAAMRTIGDDRDANSIQATFLRAGDMGRDISVEVERVRDGGSFSSRQVIMHQDGRELLRAMVSAHTGEDGEDWQQEFAAPALRPDDAHPLPAGNRLSVANAFEIRSITPWDGENRLHPYWIRLTDELDDARYMQHAALLAISDLTVIRSARASNANGMGFAAMSLDHTLWFHRPPRLTEWTYVDVYPTTNSRSRGMAQGRIMDADGRLLASLSQEVLMRMPRRPTPPTTEHTIAGG